MAFKIPKVPPTSNKSVRFPNDMLEEVEAAIRGYRLHIFRLCGGGSPGSAG